MTKNPYIFNCDDCPTKCSGVSKGIYDFGSDMEYSESFENKFIDLINTKTSRRAAKVSQAGFPDIEIRDKKGVVTSYLEIKVQQRTFMSVMKLLPKADLCPSETIALNLSDLVRYFKIFEEDEINIYIIWVLNNRPCILKGKDHSIFFQNLLCLKKIFGKYGDTRRFRRKSGQGDYVDGKHKGVVVNYHFSLNELVEGEEELIKSIQ